MTIHPQWSYPLTILGDHMFRTRLTRCCGVLALIGSALSASTARADDPLNLLFLGNSYTDLGPIPHLVRDLATDAGWATPNVQYVAPHGQTLSFHSTNPDTLNAIDLGSWDYVVMQEFSTRPTDNAGSPTTFKNSATTLYDRVKLSSPDAQVLLYETWARHPDHSIYDSTFTDPAQMQAQLRLHYNDAADNFIPANSTAAVKTDVAVAPVGDAWESYLNTGGPIRLHASDDHHAGDNGKYLTSAVIYSTIYDRSAANRTSLLTSPANAAILQTFADATTGKTTPGGPDGVELGFLAPGASIQIDFGSTASLTAGNWNNLTDSINGIAVNMIDDAGTTTAVDAAITDGFVGANSVGIAGNTLGYPGTASTDNFWTGSFDGHAEALTKPGQVTLSGLDPDAEYDLTLFASRTGTDSGNGRLTRYTVDGQWQDLEVADNADTQVVFEDITPAADGSLTIDVVASVAGTSRFGYLSLLRLTANTPSVLGDIDGNGFVGIDDLNVILVNWNQAVELGNHTQGDIAGNGDGFVGIDDLNVILANWNNGTPPTTPGDIGGDGYIGISDLNIILGNWNQNVSPGDLNAGDTDGDGFIGIADLNWVLGNWNAGVPPTTNATIPEPAGLLLWTVLATGLALRPL